MSTTHPKLYAKFSVKHYMNTVAYCSLDLSYVLDKCLPLKTLKNLHKLQEQSYKQFGELSTLKFKMAANQNTTNTKTRL